MTLFRLTVVANLLKRCFYFFGFLCVSVLPYRNCQKFIDMSKLLLGLLPHKESEKKKNTDSSIFFYRAFLFLPYFGFLFISLPLAAFSARLIVVNLTAIVLFDSLSSRQNDDVNMQSSQSSHGPESVPHEFAFAFGMWHAQRGEHDSGWVIEALLALGSWQASFDMCQSYPQRFLNWSIWVS